MIDVANIARAAVSAVKRVLDRETDSTPVRSMVLMTAADLNGDANAVREWFMTASDDTVAAAWTHYESWLFKELDEIRRIANEDGPDAAEAREFIRDHAANIRAALKRIGGDDVIKIGQLLTHAGWKPTP